MSDDLLAKSYEQLESMERTLQRAQMLQSQGRETLQGLSTNEEAMTLETSNRDSTTPLGIIRASISEYERTQELFAKISTQPGVTEEDKSHAEAQAARAKSDFEEARRTYNEVYMTYYQSNLEGLSQQEHTDEASTRRPHEDWIELNDKWMDPLPDGTEIWDREGGVTIRTDPQGRKYGEKLA